ncbi:hypothetical protein NGM10_10555 [Halorussus salilacus]|uniref:hypothetical protein n=1 Tax=Halorussus salilacus TaxID=2953750 RepID=UPI00209F68F5|nr:hypothetical protein [Halorussus salilacus]USZ67171.1 hypothetical protein NGM10_10555 [Halorussus salilacus]
MPRAKYQANLPSIHFEEDDLADIEELLRQNGENSEIELKIHNGQFTYEYSNTDEVLADNTLPDFVHSFEFTAESDDGKIKITADEDENEIKLWISGKQGWVRRKQSQIEDYFDHRGDKIRTFVEKRLAITVIGLSVGVGLIAIGTGWGTHFNVDESGDVFVMGFGGLILSAILKSIIDYLHPYTLIRLSNKKLHPYLWKGLRWATILASLLTIFVVGGQIVPV